METITEPTLLLSEQITRRNIERMSQKAAGHNLKLKPHFKTHQSQEIGRWFRDYGIRAITVSSVRMAQYFADAGWGDITVAFPYNPLISEEINELASSVNLSILLSDAAAIDHMLEHIYERVNIYIEIDTGSERTGFSPVRTNEIIKLIKAIHSTNNLHFHGFYSHPGHSYSCRSKKEIQAVHEDVMETMQTLKQEFPSATVCVGDTPCCSVGRNWEDIDEISPGNFVFYDWMQTCIGSCSAKDIAVVLACPVVARYPKRNEIAIHGGAVHLSKEKLTLNNSECFGQCVHINEDFSWNEPLTDCYVKSISQEHGIIRGGKPFINNLAIGNMIGILPVHSCLTADTMQGYMSSNSGKQIDHMRSRQGN